MDPWAPSPKCSSSAASPRAPSPDQSPAQVLTASGLAETPCPKYAPTTLHCQPQPQLLEPPGHPRFQQRLKSPVRTTQAEALADRILIGPEFSGEAAVNDSNLSSRGTVGLHERASAGQR